MSDESFQDINIPPTSSSSLSRSPSQSSSPSTDLDSLPSVSATTTSMSPSDDYFATEADREWRESLQQLELILTMVLIPYLGKYFGRKCAYWGWTRFMEWKYPVTIEVTNPRLFKAAGAVEAAASL